MANRLFEYPPVRLQPVTSKLVDDMISVWPSQSKELASAMVQKYGLPHEATSGMLIWYYNGSWKRTVAHRDGTHHNFPRPHFDLLEQTIEYRVPAEKCSELAMFNGSLIINRTRGELGVCCDSEGTNLLMLNLAHQIIISHKTVEEARRQAVATTVARRLNWPMELTERLQFAVPETEERVTADPD